MEGDFAALYDAYAREIYDFLYFKTFHKTIAEDLTSTTFLKALEAFPRFREQKGATEKSWLYRIAKNTLTDHYRTQKHHLDSETLSLPSHHTPLDDETDTQLAIQKVTAALKKLPEKDQELLILRLWQDLPYKEIALILQKTEASVKMASSRALKALHALLSLLLILTHLVLW